MYILEKSRAAGPAFAVRFGEVSPELSA